MKEDTDLRAAESSKARPSATDGGGTQAGTMTSPVSTCGPRVAAHPQSQWCRDGIEGSVYVLRTIVSPSAPSLLSLPLNRVIVSPDHTTVEME